MANRAEMARPASQANPVIRATLAAIPISTNDRFPAPAPEFGDAVRLSTFQGMDPSGTWSLFIRPDGPAAGQLTGGWGLTIEVKKRR